MHLVGSNIAFILHNWKEDVRAVVASGAEGIRIAKCESADDVHAVEAEVLKAEKEFGVEEGRTLLMAARAANVQCFDEKSIVNPKQIQYVHNTSVSTLLTGRW